jgi:CPA2 family monovalent cation:H+ antiporter-2
MILTPFATTAVDPLWQRYERWRGGPPMQIYQVPDQPLQNHIIIVGYGRVGRYTADVLQRLNLPFMVIDQDQRAVDRAKAAGQPVIYGDASSPVVLEAAGVHDARLVLVVVSAAIDVELVVRQIYVLSPQTHIVARATRLAQVEDLRRYGVYEIVQPEFEAGLELVRQTLLHFDFPAPEIEHLSDAVRNERYRPFETLHTDAQLLNDLRRARHALDIRWYTIPPAAPLAGQTIGATGIRQRSGASIIAVLREGAVTSNPEPDTILRPGDGVAVIGTVEQRDAFAALLAPALESRE